MKVYGLKYNGEFLSFVFKTTREELLDKANAHAQESLNSWSEELKSVEFNPDNENEISANLRDYRRGNWFTRTYEIVEFKVE